MLTWQNRITRILVRERDLFGQWASRWQVIRTSNAYVFTDPKPQLAGVFHISPKIRRELRTKKLLIFLVRWRETRTALWSAPCGSSVPGSKEVCS